MNYKFVIIEIKTHKLTHQDIGQLQMYVNYYDRIEKLAHENPTIGILLCANKNFAVVKFTLPEDEKQANVAQQQNKQQVQQQAQGQQPQQQKPIAQRYNDALNAIKNAKNPQTLDKAISTFATTQYASAISKACRARADLMGWSEAPPQNQSQQQNQLHH